jgi:hypothetical protein
MVGVEVDAAKSEAAWPAAGPGVLGRQTNPTSSCCALTVDSQRTVWPIRRQFGFLKGNPAGD